MNCLRLPALAHACPLHSARLTCVSATRYVWPRVNRELFFVACRKLTLKQANLSSLPPELCLLRNLTSLDVSHNSLRSFAVAPLTSLQGLRSLDLSHNQLAVLPAALFSLKLLEELDVSNNPNLQVLIAWPPVAWDQIWW